MHFIDLLFSKKLDSSKKSDCGPDNCGVYEKYYAAYAYATLTGNLKPYHTLPILKNFQELILNLACKVLHKPSAHRLS